MRDPLNLWTVYDHPTDYPRAYVARRIEIGQGTITATDDVIESRDLMVLREVLAMRGLDRMERHPEDDTNIIEVWM